MKTPNKNRTKKAGERMMGPPYTNAPLPCVGHGIPLGKVWGKVACTVLGVEPYGRVPSSKWGYIPTGLDASYFELDDGTILSGGGDGVPIWYLIGTRQHLAIEGYKPERLTEPRYGFESPWTARKAELLKRTRSVIPSDPPPKRSDEELFAPQYAYGQIVQQLDICRVLVDVGCGTITANLGNWLNCRSEDWPQVRVGDFIKCHAGSPRLYNVRPISEYEGIPGKVLRCDVNMQGIEIFLYIELLNGEMVYGFAAPFGDIHTYPEKFLNTFVNFRWHWLGDDFPLEHIAEPRYGITSPLTPHKQEVLDHSYPELLWDEDERYFKGGTFTSGTGSPERDEGYKPPWARQVTMYGILKEVPYHEELLLDTGMGTLFVPAKDGFAPGDFVKLLCIDAQLEIEELPGYPTE